MTAHLGDDGFFFDDRTAEVKQLPAHSQIVIRHDCGRTQLIQVVCGDPLCVECSKIRANRIQARWRPVLMAMSRPKLITLTMKSQPILKDCIADFQKSFRRFMDLRLGKRGLPKLICAALDFVHDPDGYQGALDRDEERRAERWEASIEKFRRSVESKAKSIGKPPRMRDVTGAGFAAYEVIYNPDEGWHFHRHCTVDGDFIPWPVLVAAWKIATKGAGWIVDIRAISKSRKKKPDGKPYDPMQEVIKYVTKSWEVPPGKHDELRQGIRDIKRIWPLGGARPVEAVSICPFCKKEGCKAHRVTGLVAIIAEGRIPGGVQYRQVWDDREQKSYMFTRDHGIWEGLADEAAPLDLIDSAIACHSTGSP